MMQVDRAPGGYSRGLRRLTLVAALATFVLVVVGGIVRVTGSGLGCPDWPLCYGQVLPPPQIESIIEYSHRTVAGFVSLLIVSLAIWAWRVHRSDRALVLPALAAVGALVVQILLGAITVVYELPPLIVWVHLGTALAIFACVVVAATNVWRSPKRLSLDAPLQGRIVSLAIAAAISTYILLLLGATVVNTGASLACSDWPLCQGQLIPLLRNPLVVIHFTHRFAALASGILVVLLAITAWRVRDREAWLARWALTLLGLFVAQAIIGGLAVLTGMPTLLRGLHLAAATAVWGVAVALVTLLLRSRRAGLGVTSTPREQSRPEAVPGLGATPMAAQPSRLSKYVRLSKPWIIALLLTTTLTSMLIAGKGSASLSLIVFTLLGGALASSGANAINCYIDRDIDGLMSRTKNRPIPRDRMAPAQALAYGLIASFASFAVLAMFVNLLAATLAVFGIIYYVFVYTRWLKRSTPHNIVIGGIAGAIPPLVGWAAVTGRVDLLALYLFLIVFYWTPPHTWALAILVRTDYERAGVPMLPVVRGEAETRRQIWLYSLQLVAVTLLIFAFRMLGWVYLAVALALNGLFLWLAFRLMRDMDKAAARRLYKYSQLYLALLFVAMVIDAGLIG